MQSPNTHFYVKSIQPDEPEQQTVNQQGPDETALPMNGPAVKADTRPHSKGPTTKEQGGSTGPMEDQNSGLLFQMWPRKPLEEGLQ